MKIEINDDEFEELIRQWMVKQVKLSKKYTAPEDREFHDKWGRIMREALEWNWPHIYGD